MLGTQTTLPAARRSRTNSPGKAQRALAQPDTRSGSAGWVFPLLCVGLVLVAISIYARVASYPFVNFDDGPYVFENPHVSGGLSWAMLRWAFTSSWAGNWHPLTWISHALDCQLFGLNAGWHHVTNLGLHLINVALLFWLLARATGDKWSSLAVASLFALHPLDVESVAWVAERKNLLCALFFLLSLGAYGWYARRPSVVRYLGVASLFALSLLAKGSAITLPFVLLVLDYWPLQRIEGWIAPSPIFPPSRARFSRLVLEKLPLLALSVAGGIVIFFAQRSVGAVAHVAGWPFSWRVGNAIHSYGTYLYLVFFPHGLAPFYPAAALHIFQVLWAAALVITVSWFAWRFRAQAPYLVAGWLWFLGALLPVIGLIQVGSQAMADRYTYIPMMGLLVAVVWGAGDLLRTREARPLWGYAAVGFAVLLLSVATWQQVRYWDNSYDLWTRDLQATQSNFVAEENLAVSLLDLGREDEAFPHFERVIALKPDDVVAWLNVGNHLEREGDHAEAIQAFQRVLALAPAPDKLLGAYRGLGVAYAQQGNLASARTNFLRALQLNPNGQTEMYNLSLLEVRDGISRLRQGLSAHPTPQGYWQLGQLLQEDERAEEARLAYEKALQLNPRMKEAQQSLQSLKQTQN